MMGGYNNKKVRETLKINPLTRLTGGLLQRIEGNLDDASKCNLSSVTGVLNGN